MKKILLTIAILCSISSIYAQKENPAIRQGNRSYAKSNFSEAEAKYTKAKTQNPKSLIATYNLANSQYKQGNYQGSIENYQLLEHTTTNKDTLSKILYNTGNAFVKIAEDSLKIQNLNGAITNLESAKKYYKAAIKNNPQDIQAKYNYLMTDLILQQLKQQQQNQQSNQNKQQKDKKQDQQDKQQNQQNQDKDKQNKQQDQQQAQIPYEEMQKLLNAIDKQDLKNQEKVKVNLQKNVKTKDKNW